MKNADLALIKDAKRILNDLQVESLPYLTLYIKPDFIEVYTYLSHAREWLLMAVDDAMEAESFDATAQRSKTKTGKENCERMCQHKLTTVKLYYARAMPWYHKYLKAVAYNNNADRIKYISVA